MSILNKINADIESYFSNPSIKQELLDGVDKLQEEFNADSDMIAYGANIRFSKNPELIKKWGLKKNDYYLIVGRLIPDNNSDIIIREFVRSKSLKNLVIVGDVPYKENYDEKIKSIKDKILFFTGYVNDKD